MSSEGADKGKQVKVGFIGAGKMSQALIKGMIKSGKVKPECIFVSARTDQTRDTNKALGVVVCSSNSEVATVSDVLFLGVKPHQIVDIINEVKSAITPQTIVVSIAAGTTLATMEKVLPPGSRVLRVMPNLPVEVGYGTCAITSGTLATSQDETLVGDLLSGSGYIENMTEANLEVCSAVLATMYGSVAIEAMADGCVKMGMPRAQAIRVSAQSLLGAGHMVLESGKHPAVIKDEVCSPAGTTIDALFHLEQNGLRAALIGAIEVQTNKCRQMAKEFK